MPPRLLRIPIGQSRLRALSIGSKDQQICLFCSVSQLSTRSGRGARTRKSSSGQARQQTTEATLNTLSPALSSRTQLRDALLDLQKHAQTYVNISRLQLALRGLDQAAGNESIRVAILGLADGGSSVAKAKSLLRLLVADPLKTEEEWERLLLNGGSKPVLLRVGYDGSEEMTQTNRLVQELHASSALLAGHKLEILILEMDPPANDTTDGSFTDAVLVPTMEIPTSNTGRYTPVTTPVHKALLVGRGISGAAALLSFPPDLDREIVGTAVDLQVGSSEEKASLPFQLIDLNLGTEALQSFRQSVDNALHYEKHWFESGIPELLDWLKAGTSSEKDVMKAPLRKLIRSIIRNTTLSIEAEQSRRLNAALSKKIAVSDATKLQRRLNGWAEDAHTELRDQLDIAFEGQRWRKLGWWKLFWRVDDVSMISTDILNQRFLLNAEKGAIFLAGRVEESGAFRGDGQQGPDWAYKLVEYKIPKPKLGKTPVSVLKDFTGTPEDTLPTKVELKPWPLHIPVTRAYLSQETIPALQALAQELVLQTLSTSSFATVLGGLMYVGSVSTGLYEAGAVTALGIVWSLRRMQQKWETARKFWEGEVREEGRKAVRGVESSFTHVLTSSGPPIKVDEELAIARQAVEAAEAALAECK